MTNLNDFGNEYQQPSLEESQLLADPFKQFEVWMLHAINNQELEPNAMSLATVSADYQISMRMMLLKYFDENGFVFFSNYNSQKAKSIAQIPHAALLFWWAKSARQVRIQGKVCKLEAKHSDQYFAKRAIDSQCAAIVSSQSSVLANKLTLLEKYRQTKQQYAGQTIPRPDYWGGYILKPDLFEFWQGQPHRLHDRFQYQKTQAGWEMHRLCP